MAIYKRGRTYWARAQRGGKEFRASLQTTAKGKAEERYREWLAQLGASAWGEKPRRSLQATVDAFVEKHLTTIKPSSAKRYGVSLVWLTDRMGTLFMDQIGTEQLSDFETWRRSQGAKPPTIRRDFACLSAVFASAQVWGWIEEGKNPVTGYLKRRAMRGLREAPPRTRYLSEADEVTLLQAASPAVAKAIAFAIDCGLRREEMFSLMWPQIDFAKGVIFTTTKTKSGRSRAVPLSDRAAQISAQLRAAQRTTVSSVHVFTHEDGTRIGQMEKGFKGAVRRAGLSDLRWHDLRRTAGCRWLQRDGLSISEVSLLLGHSSVQVTESRYAFLKEEEVAQKPAHRRAENLEK